MGHFDYLTTLAYVYLGQLIAFSFCQISLMRNDNKTQIVFWVIASAFSAVSTLCAPHLLTVLSVRDFAVWAGLASLVGGLFRYAALSYRSRSFEPDAWARFFAILAMLGIPFALFPPLLPYRLLITSLIGASISVACLRAVWRNSYWKSRNTFGCLMVAAGMAISAFILMARGFTSYPFGADQTFVGASNYQIRAFEMLVLISLFLQIGFVAMLVARQDKVRKFSDLRNVRAWQRSALLKQRRRDLQILSEQRLELIQLLTHEVRQPINNAQASLQSIAPALSNGPDLSPRGEHALQRAQAALDGITLALSNVIVVETMVSEEGRWSRQTTDIAEVLEMARLDCAAQSRQQIALTSPGEIAFVECVPTLIRFALHNMLNSIVSICDNEEKIELVILNDYENIGIIIKAKGKLKPVYDKKYFIDNVLRVTDTNTGKLPSLGFLVVNLIAKYHKGKFSIQENNNREFVTQLFIPAI